MSYVLTRFFMPMEKRIALEASEGNLSFIRKNIDLIKEEPEGLRIALSSAMRSSSWWVMEYLVEEAKIDVAGSLFPDVLPLMAARQRFERLNYILGHGARIEEGFTAEYLEQVEEGEVETAFMNHYIATMRANKAVAAELSKCRPLVEKTLRYISNQGQADVLRMIIDERADIEGDRQKALYLASRKKGAAEFVKTLIDAGAKPAEADAKLLHGALHTQDEELINLLIDEGARVDDAALFFAVKKGMDGIALRLMQEGADPNGLNGDIAEEIVKSAKMRVMLDHALDHGFDFDRHGGRMLVTAMAQRAHKRIALLLREGLDPDAEKGRALKQAIRNNDLMALSLLMEHGGDVHVDNGALLYAARQSGPVTRYLIGKGFDVERYGEAAMIWAVSQGEVGLVKSYAMSDVPKDSPIMKKAVRRAFELGHVKTIAAIAAAGKLDGNLDNGDLFMLAIAKAKSETLFPLLLANGADIKSEGVRMALRDALRRQKGTSAYMLLRAGVLCKDADRAFMRALIDMPDKRVGLQIALMNGANPNLDDGFPLQYALQKKNASACKILLAWGADPTLDKDHLGQLAKAAGNSFVEILQAGQSAWALKASQDRKNRSRAISDCRDSLFSNDNADDKPPPPGGQPGP